MKLFYVFLLLICVTSVCLNAQTTSNSDNRSYSNELKKERKLKDIEMRTDEHSPITKEEKAVFKHLNYYKPKPEFRKVAAFKRFDQALHFLMKTTTDRLPEYSLYGTVAFTHKGKEYSLNVYQNIELVKKPGYEKHLFIPFNDETNGKATYGGGRFLDVNETGDDSIIIDFNKAYNPYCAYNHKYSCPIPPEENNLQLEIRSGEKKWHK